MSAERLQTHLLRVRAEKLMSATTHTKVSACPCKESPRTYQEINSEVDILHKLIVSHINITDSDRQAQDFLHLELDGALDISDLEGNQRLKHNIASIPTHL